MKPNKPHFFVAIPIPDSMKQQINEGRLQIQQQISFKKWVFPADYHITLKFLGVVDNETMMKLKPLIEQIASKQSSFSLALEGLNIFGKTVSPRILWTDVKGDLNPLSILQKKVDTAMQSLGFVLETRPYTPHLTIAKNYSGKEPFESILLEQTAKHLPQPLKWEVNEMVLYQTHLGRKPMYGSIEVFTF